MAERDAGQEDRERDAPNRGADEDETADHGWAGRRRIRRYPPRAATITTAAMIGRSTSLVLAVSAGGVASPSVGLGATTADAVGSVDVDGGAETGELGVGGPRAGPMAAA